MDSDSDGVVSKAEFKEAFTGAQKRELRQALHAVGQSWKGLFESNDEDENKELIALPPLKHALIGSCILMPMCWYSFVDIWACPWQAIDWEEFQRMAIRGSYKQGAGC